MSRIQVRFRDGRGYEASSDAYAALPVGATVTQILTALATWLTHLNAVTASKITECVLHLPVDISGLTPNTPTGVTNNAALGITFPNSVDDTVWSYIVPGLKESLIVGGNPNFADGGTIDVLADFMEAAFDVAGTGDGAFTNPGGSSLVTARRAFPSTRKLGKRLAGRHSSLGA